MNVPPGLIIWFAGLLAISAAAYFDYRDMRALFIGIGILYVLFSIGLLFKRQAKEQPPKKSPSRLGWLKVFFIPVLALLVLLAIFRMDSLFKIVVHEAVGLQLGDRSSPLVDDAVRACFPEGEFNYAACTVALQLIDQMSPKETATEPTNEKGFSPTRYLPHLIGVFVFLLFIEYIRVRRRRKKVSHK